VRLEQKAAGDVRMPRCQECHLKYEEGPFRSAPKKSVTIDEGSPEYALIEALQRFIYHYTPSNEI
jgi:hypothetical protein